MKRQNSKQAGAALQFLGFGLPATFIWAAVVIIPFIYGIGITFTDWNGLSMSIHFIGIEWLSTSWLTDPKKALAALVIVSAWQLSGYLMVIYIAGLTSISKELLEAAQIDGATGWQVVRRVKIPLVRNSITICTFLAISRTFMSFDMNLSLTAGGPYKSTELIAYKIYQTAFTSMEFGKGQAQAIVLFVIVAIISLFQVYLTSRGGEE